MPSSQFPTPKALDLQHWSYFFPSTSHSKLMTSCCLSLFRLNICSTTSFAEPSVSRSIQTSSKFNCCKHFLTNLHWRKQCPPSSLRRQHIGQRVSISISQRTIFIRKGRLLCANLHRNCFTFGMQSIFQSRFQNLPTGSVSVQLVEPTCFTFLCSWRFGLYLSVFSPISSC